MSDDAQLLRDFTRTGSSEAFKALVDRHVDLVYSAARRQLRNAHEAEDVTQAVFLVLAGKARTLRNAALLPAWLLKITQYAVTNHRKYAARRRKYEQEAATMMARETPAFDPEWEKLSPYLDAALARLSTLDRAAVVAHCIEQQSISQVAAGLGLSEPAARKRIQRSLERLRVILAPHGAASAAALPGLLAGHGLMAAPTGLGTAVATSALAAFHGTAITGSTTLLAKGVYHMMFWIKVKMVVAGGLAALIMTAGTGTIVHYATAQTPLPVANKVSSEAVPMEATTAPSLPTATKPAFRTFNSSLALNVWIWHPKTTMLETLGITPDKEPLVIPNGVDWGVTPIGDPLDMVTLASEVNAKNIPGLALQFPDNETLAAIKDLTHLQILFAGSSGKRITDEGVVELKNLKDLKILDLHNSRITNVGLGVLAENCPHLQTLNLHDTDISDAGLAQLQNLTELETLIIPLTIVTDAGMQYVKEIKSLRHLELDNPGITDRALPELKELPNLESLELVGANVTDAGVVALGDMIKLKKLNLLGTKVTDVGLAELKRLQNLEELNLCGTQVTDAGLVELQEFKNLKYLDLRNTPVTDAGLEALIKLKELQTLYLNGTQITNAGLEKLANLPNLQVLGLSETSVTDEGMAAVKKLNHLTDLSLCKTSITDVGLIQLQELKQLQMLDVSETNVTFNGQTKLFGFSSLKRFYLNRAKVTDISLGMFSKLRGLEVLDLSNNTITDQQLSSLQGSRQLKTLYLIGTQATKEGIAELKKLMPNCSIVNY